MSKPYVSNLLFGTLVSITLLLLAKVSPYFSVLLLVFLGLNLSYYIFKDITYRISVSAALGFSVTILLAYILSSMGLGISILPYLIGIIAILTFDIRKYTRPSREEAILLGKLFVTIASLILVKALIIRMPTDDMDSIFHAYKIQYIVRFSTLFPPVVPTFNVLSYPGGYHVLVSWVVFLSEDTIPHAMLVVRIWSWVLILLGTYLFGSLWLDRSVGLYSAMFVLVSNVYTYYLLNYIHPNFLGFYFFLTALALFHFRYLNKKKLTESHVSRIILILVSSGMLFIHPYTFQAFVFIALAYLLSGTYYSDKTLRDIIVAVLHYFVIPLICYALLNPYFWWPELASKVIIEYPWASWLGVTIKNLAVFTGKAPEDQWNRFSFLIKWITIRNNTYASLSLILLSILGAIKKRYPPSNLISLWGFVIFVFILILNRLTYNFPVPFYGTAAIERMFLWLAPLFPVFMAVGFVMFLESISKIVRSKRVFISIVVIFLALLFILPARGIAYDMLSDEANYYVDHNNLKDFEWINERYSNITVLNSCYTDAAQWIPFFTSNKVLFSYINYCRVYNITPKLAEALLMSDNSSLNATLAYIDTNHPSLDPLVFYNNFKLLRYNNGNWVFNLTSKNTSENYQILRQEIVLCTNRISGDIYKDGRYYIYGFTKKYFMVEYFYLNGIDYAWLSGQNGTIVFVPCNGYNRVNVSIISLADIEINTTVIINGVPHIITVKPGENLYSFQVSIQKNKLNIIKILKSKNDGIFLIKYIEFGD